MERHGVDERQAFELLRQQARSSNRRVIELAHAVVDGHALLPNRADVAATGLPRARAGQPARMIATLKRTFKKFQADEMTDRAAALTYFVMMSLFPALLVGVALLGLLGDQSLVTDAVGYAREHGAPAEATDALDASLTATVENAGGAVSVALVLRHRWSRSTARRARSAAPAAR